ncbi:MAG: hypothetical protein ACR2F8_10030 [Caulobacteraceae bacterium]
MMRPTLMILGVAALALSACGKVGALDQPAPLYGEKAKADYQAKQEAAAAKAKKDDQPDAVTPDKTYDPNADPSPQRTLPIQGTNPSPNGPPPPGVLPDPFNNPGPPRD